MTIQPLATTDQSPSGGTAAKSKSPDNMSQNQFLQLLVAQIRYQDPTNPSDSTAFVTQLAQFSSLEQLIAIHSDLDTQIQSGATSADQGGH